MSFCVSTIRDSILVCVLWSGAKRPWRSLLAHPVGSHPGWSSPDLLRAEFRGGGPLDILARPLCSCAIILTLTRKDANMAPPKTVADLPSPTPSAQPHSLSPSDIVVTRDLAGTA